MHQSVFVYDYPDLIYTHFYHFFSSFQTFPDIFRQKFWKSFSSTFSPILGEFNAPIGFCLRPPRLDSYLFLDYFIYIEDFLHGYINVDEFCLHLSPKDGRDNSLFVWWNSKSVNVATNFHQNFGFGRNCLVRIRLSFRCDWLWQMATLMWTK